MTGTRAPQRIAVGAMAIGLAVTAGMGSVDTATASDSSQGSVAAAEALELLYAVSASSIRVVPGKGASARVVLRRPDITQFTDRPARLATVVHPATMLTAFGWTVESGRLRGVTPNAAITVPGSDTQVVRIRTAAIRGDRLVLRVSGITGPVTSVRGPGSIFVDSATVTAVQSQSVVVSSSPELTMTATVYSNSTLTITLQSGSQVLATNTIDPTMGATTWSPSFAIPGGGEVSDLRVGSTFMQNYTGGTSEAFIQALGTITLPPPDLVAPIGGSLTFDSIPAPAPGPWPPPLPSGFDNATG